MATHNMVMTFQDFGGRTATTKLPIAGTVFSPSDTGVTAILAAVQGVCAAAITQVEISTQDGTPAGTLGTGGYQAIEDRVLGSFEDTLNRTSTFAVPSPKEALFTNPDDTNELTPTVTAYAAYISKMVAGAKSQTGNTLSFKHGIRTRKKLQKR